MPPPIYWPRLLRSGAQCSQTGQGERGGARRTGGGGKEWETATAGEPPITHRQSGALAVLTGLPEGKFVAGAHYFPDLRALSVDRPRSIFRISLGQGPPTSSVSADRSTTHHHPAVAALRKWTLVRVADDDVLGAVLPRSSLGLLPSPSARRVIGPSLQSTSPTPLLVCPSSAPPHTATPYPAQVPPHVAPLRSFPAPPSPHDAPRRPHRRASHPRCCRGGSFCPLLRASARCSD